MISEYGNEIRVKGYANSLKGMAEWFGENLPLRITTPQNIERQLHEYCQGRWNTTYQHKWVSAKRRHYTCLESADDLVMLRMVVDDIRIIECPKINFHFPYHVAEDILNINLNFLLYLRYPDFFDFDKTDILDSGYYLEIYNGALGKTTKVASKRYTFLDSELSIYGMINKDILEHGFDRIFEIWNNCERRGFQEIAEFSLSAGKLRGVTALATY